MNTILMWVIIIGLGGFFSVLLIYSFYLILFSKNEEETPVDTNKDLPEVTPRGIKNKFIGRA